MRFFIVLYYRRNYQQILEKDLSFNQLVYNHTISSATVMSHYSSMISNTKFYMWWDIISSSSIDVKVMHFKSLVKGDVGLLFAALKKNVYFS